MKLNQQLRNLEEEVAADRITLRQMQREQFNSRRAGDFSNDNGAWAGMTSSPFQNMQLEPPSLLRPYRCSFFYKKIISTIRFILSMFFSAFAFGTFYNVHSIVLNYNSWIIILSSHGGLQHFTKLQHGYIF